MAAPNLDNLQGCIVDARQAIQDRQAVTPGLPRYQQLLSEFYSAMAQLPQRYQQAVAVPCLWMLKQLGPAGYAATLQSPQYAPLWESILAVLQAGMGFEEAATAAVQEIVSDLYEGFLSEEDRRGIKSPDRSMLTPLVKWGASRRGPYTFTCDAMAPLGLQTAIVNLPVCNARAGLISWPSLSHETAGHDILTADDGLLSEVRELLGATLASQGYPEHAQYWVARLDETLADVVSVLNLGPTAVLGFVGHFRALRSLALGSPRLTTYEGASGRYPPDILRAFVQAEVVARLSFSDATAWADALRREIERDLGTPIVIMGRAVDSEQERVVCSVVAEVLASSKLQSLSGHALDEIQNWRDSDEAVTVELRRILQSEDPLPRQYQEGTYAAHAMAAAVTAAVQQQGDPRRLIGRLRTMLVDMHRSNPLWNSRNRSGVFQPS